MICKGPISTHTLCEDNSLGGEQKECKLSPQNTGSFHQSDTLSDPSLLIQQLREVRLQQKDFFFFQN